MSKETEIAILINALAVAIGNSGFNTDELNLISSIFSQIGDTLDTMASQRAIDNSLKNKN